MEDASNKPIGVAQRPKLMDLRSSQELNVHTNCSCGRGVLVILIHAIIVHCQPKVANLVKANGLACFGFEFPVQLDRILVNLADAIAHIKERQ